MLKSNRKQKEEQFGEEHLTKSKEYEKNQLNEVIFTIKSVTKNKRKQWLITFNNDQVWKQIEHEYIKLSAGDDVELTKGMFGAIYLRKIGNNKKIKVRRNK